MKSVFGTLAITAAIAISSQAHAATPISFDFTTSTSTARYYDNYGGGQAVFASGYGPNSADGALLGNHYFTLTLHGSSGSPLNLDNLSFTATKSSVRDAGYFVRGSADNYSSHLSSLDFFGRYPASTSQEIQFGSPYQNVAEASFRFYFYDGDRDGQLGFENIAFKGTTAVSAAPEPGTWAMMILGFGLVGFALRRRRNVTTRVAFAA